MFPPEMKGHIIIPDTAAQRCNQGIIKYIGKDCKLGLKLGQHVLFSGYTGEIIRIEGEGDLIVLPERWVTAILDDDEFVIPGLYFSDGEEFITANLTIALQLISRAASESVNYKEVIEHKPTASELYSKSEDE